MKGFSFASAAIAAAGVVSLAAAQNTNPVDPIVIKGSKFFYKTNGTQLYVSATPCRSRVNRTVY